MQTEKKISAAMSLDVKRYNEKYVLFPVANPLLFMLCAVSAECSIERVTEEDITVADIFILPVMLFFLLLPSVCCADSASFTYPVNCGINLRVSEKTNARYGAAFPMR